MDNSAFIDNIVRRAINFRKQTIVAEIRMAKLLLVEMDACLEKMIGESIENGRYEILSDQIMMLYDVRSYALEYGAKFNQLDVLRRMFKKTDIYTQLIEVEANEYNGFLNINGQVFEAGDFAEPLYHLATDMFVAAGTDMAVRQREQVVKETKKELFRGIDKEEVKELRFQWKDIGDNLLAMTLTEWAHVKSHAYDCFTHLSNIRWIANEMPLNGTTEDYHHLEVINKIDNFDRLLEELYPGSPLEPEAPLVVADPRFIKFTKTLQFGLDYFMNRRKQLMWYRGEAMGPIYTTTLDDVRTAAEGLRTKTRLKSKGKLHEQLVKNLGSLYPATNAYAVDILMGKR
jgi:hypothetical protein